MGITDRREIRFQADAVLAAIASQPQAGAALGLPAAAPDTLRFEPASHRVVLLYRIGREVADFGIPAESLGALLVGFCCRQRISLPRRAMKSICIEAQAVVLAFSIRL